jgi:hypothetical protein
MYNIDYISLSSSKNEKCFRKKVVEKIKTHILCSKTFSDNRAVYEIMLNNIVETTQAAVDNMAHAHCILDT